MNTQAWLSNRNRTIALSVISVLMIFVSVYLTMHFFEVRFPKGLSGGSICNINEFFNCDKTTNSPLAAPFDMPISVFGTVIGLLVLAGAFVKDEKYTNTLYGILILNFAGCVVLFLYSLLHLSSICLFCSFYYVLSAAALFIYFKTARSFIPHPGVLAAALLAVGLAGASVRQVVHSKQAEVEKADALLKDSVMSEYSKLEKINFDASGAPAKINTVENAPLKMVIFSDFECPACRMLSEQLPEILAEFKDKIDISYFFYPLDRACNPGMTREMHRHACKAAAAALCLPNSDFHQLHDTFFNNQNSFEDGFVDKFIVQNNIEACVNDKTTQDRLKQIVMSADIVKIRSTPTFLLNGAKFEGVVPFYKLKIIMNALLAGQTQ
jgi:protein-disulfide isomerase/uncharacterized membrane protein